MAGRWLPIGRHKCNSETECRCGKASGELVLKRVMDSGDIIDNV